MSVNISIPLRTLPSITAEQKASILSKLRKLDKELSKDVKMLEREDIDFSLARKLAAKDFFKKASGYLRDMVTSGKASKSPSMRPDLAEGAKEVLPKAWKRLEDIIKEIEGPQGINHKFSIPWRGPVSISVTRARQTASILYKLQRLDIELPIEVEMLEREIINYSEARKLAANDFFKKASAYLRDMVTSGKASKSPSMRPDLAEGAKEVLPKAWERLEDISKEFEGLPGINHKFSIPWQGPVSIRVTRARRTASILYKLQELDVQVSFAIRNLKKDDENSSKKELLAANSSKEERLDANDFYRRAFEHLRVFLTSGKASKSFELGPDCVEKAKRVLPKAWEYLENIIKEIAGLDGIKDNFSILWRSPAFIEARQTASRASVNPHHS